MMCGKIKAPACNAKPVFFVVGLSVSEIIWRNAVESEIVVITVTSPFTVAICHQYQLSLQVHLEVVCTYVGE
jgi:hypothetical protein